MEPYESIYTGHFIFMLGYCGGLRRLKPDGNCVSLLAQNPGDQVIGDVVASWSGLTSIIEFKRREDTVRTEFQKPAKKRLLDGLKQEANARVLGISRCGHFLAFGSVVAGRTADVRVLPYADIADSAEQHAPSLSMHQFLDQILDGQRGWSPTDFNGYVKLLKKMHEGAAGRSAPGTMSSLILNVDRVTRRFTFGVVDLLHLRELQLDHEVSIPEVRRSPPKRRERNDYRGR